MPIKNYTTKVPASNTVGEIQAILAKHGACRVTLDYGDDGRVLCVSFSIPDIGSFKLPARAGAVMLVMRDQGINADIERAERVAWRNVKDWIDAQMALIETGQTSMAEVMLPYMLRDGVTLYEAMADRMLSDGSEQK